MKPIIKSKVLFPAEKLVPDQNAIVLSGTPYAWKELSRVTFLFKTSADTILEAIWVKFVNESGNAQLKGEFQKLYKGVCVKAFCRSIILADDMLICGADKAFIDAIAAMAAVGFEYGYLFPRELEYYYRVNRSTAPVEALELQELVDKELDHWSTVETLSTDPEQIANWELFHSVLYSLSDMLGD